MKKKSILIGLLCVIALSSCHKEKFCRCSVRHEQKVRIITVRHSASCGDIRYVEFNASGAQLGVVDSVFCTDYVFDADTLFY